MLQKSYRPVATLSTVSAMAALIDVTGGVGARGGATSSSVGGAADGPSGSDDEKCKAAAPAEVDEGGGGDAAGVADDAVEEVAIKTLFLLIYVCFRV